MGKSGFALSVIMLSIVVTSLIANSLLFSVINQLRDELSELEQDLSELRQRFPAVEFQTISKGYRCGHEFPAYYVIENESRWTTLWNQYMDIAVPPQDSPELDFSNITVIAVFMGEFPTGGYEIKIKEIISTSQSVVVIVEQSYGGGVIVDAFTQPYHIVKMSQVDKEVTFETFEKTIECP